MSEERIDSTQLPSLSELKFGEIEIEGQVEVITAQTVMERMGGKVIRVLGELAPFSSNEAMRKFVYGIPDLSPWKYSIPEANSVADRVNFVTFSLRGKKRTDGREALEIFLRELHSLGEKTKKES